MAAASEPPPPLPQKNYVGGKFVDPHPINLPEYDLERMAREQRGHQLGTPEHPDSHSNLRYAAAAPSYRTLGDAAKAGVDPLNFLQTMSSKTPTGEPENPYASYYWIAAIAAFFILAIGGFIYASRTPDAPET